MTEIEYDFDGSLRLADAALDFFFSPSTGLYVFRHPLPVDGRVRRAAGEVGVAVRASPEKWLVDTPLADALRVVRALGGTALSLPEFFRVRADAIAAGDRDMVASLESDQFIEMLDTVFVRDECMIHHPMIQRGFSGPGGPVDTPRGRYGWIDPAEIDLATGAGVVAGVGRSEPEDAVARVEPGQCERAQVVGAEVLCDPAGGARGSEGVPELGLRGPEVALQVVGRGRQKWVVEAGEDQVAVPRGHAGDVVDEGGVGGGEAETRGLLLQVAEQPVEAVPRLAAGARAIDALRIGRDLVGDEPQDTHVVGDAARRPGAVPVGLQRLVEAREDRVWAPPFRAAS